ELAPPDEWCFSAHCFEESGRRRCRRRGRGREVELDQSIASIRRQQAALGMKPRLLLWLQVTVFPQHVRARERRVATEIDFDRGCEPAQIVPVFLRNEERSLGEI